MKSPLSFGNRVAIVTGGTGIIGLAIARSLLESGLRVAVIGSREESIQAAKKVLNPFSETCNLWKCNLVEIGNISETLESINAFFGSIDIVVNGIGIVESQEVLNVTEQEWDRTLDTNLKSSFFVCQQAIPYLIKGSYPRIINISSNAGRMGGFASGTAYAASKAGVIGITYSLARRLAIHGITVNVVAPGTIQSEMAETFEPHLKEELIKQFPLGRLGKPEEVASAVAYFASIESSFTTGAILDVNGGIFMG